MIIQLAEDKTLYMKKTLFFCLVVYVFLAGPSCTKDGGGKGFTSPTTGKGGSLARFTVVGSYLYAIDKTHLKVFDISSEKPLLKSSKDVGFEIETIFPFKDKLFIGSTSVVHIFSIENPENPMKLSTAISPEILRRCDPVVAKDTVAYATLRTNATCGGSASILAVYDIRDVLNPSQVYSEGLVEPYGLGYSGDALYVCDKNSLVVFDISNAFMPERITQVEGEQFFDVIAYDNTLVCWTARGVALFDITKKFDPRLITNIN